MRPYLPTLVEGAKAVQLADLAYRSTAEQRWMKVPGLEALIRAAGRAARAAARVSLGERNAGYLPPNNSTVDCRRDAADADSAELLPQDYLGRDVPARP